MNRELFKGDRSKPMTPFYDYELSTVLTPLTLFPGRVSLGSKNREGYGWGQNQRFLCS